MFRKQASDDLVIEVHDGEPPIIKIVSLGMEADGEAPGTVVCFEREIEPLTLALLEAAAVAFRMQQEQGGGV